MFVGAGGGREKDEREGKERMRSRLLKAARLSIFYTYKCIFTHTHIHTFTYTQEPWDPRIPLHKMQFKMEHTE